MELRALYLISGDEEFDGGGWSRTAPPGYNLINDSYTDNAWLFNLALSFKLGKHPEKTVQGARKFVDAAVAGTGQDAS